MNMASLTEGYYKVTPCHVTTMEKEAMSYDRDVSIEMLKEMLNYDPISGEIRWAKSPARNVYAGELAGSVKSTRITKSGVPVQYRYIRLNGVNIPAQRIAWALTHGEMPIGRVTFNDGDTLNLRESNLGMQNVLPANIERRQRDNERYRAHREAHGISYRDSDMQRRFGISLHVYGQMLVAQNGKCAICSAEDGGTRKGNAKAFAIDHDHNTGKVRGLLCEACNQGIGKLKDDPEILRKAADYIDRHKADS